MLPPLLWEDPTCQHSPQMSDQSEQQKGKVINRHKTESHKNSKFFKKIQSVYSHIQTLTSYCIKREESSNNRSSLFRGLSRVASARQRRVSLPVPYSLITDRIFSLMPGVMGILLLPTRMCVHLSITPSGAPYEQGQIRK